jgi:hypothetical protein
VQNQLNPSIYRYVKEELFLEGIVVVDFVVAEGHWYFAEWVEKGSLDAFGFAWL